MKATSRTQRVSAETKSSVPGQALLYTRKQSAALLNCSVMTVMRLEAAGALRRVRLPPGSTIGKVYHPASDVHALAEVMRRDKPKIQSLVDDGTPVAWQPDDGRRFTREQIAQAQGKGIIKHAAPCPHCRGETFIVEAGRGPHWRHLRCLECRRGGMWLAKPQSPT